MHVFIVKFNEWNLIRKALGLYHKSKFELNLDIYVLIHVCESQILELLVISKCFFSIFFNANSSAICNVPLSLTPAALAIFFRTLAILE